MQQRVRVYRNLNNGRLTVQHKVDGSWRLSHYVDAINLIDARMIVSLAGHARAVREGQRNVHAFIEGIVAPTLPPTPDMRPLRYNPFEAPAFFDADTRAAVASSAHVRIESHGKKGSPAPIFYKGQE
jgi:hypothetical protein